MAELDDQTINAVTAAVAVAVLKQRADDHTDRLDAHDKALTEQRIDAEIREARLRTYIDRKLEPLQVSIDRVNETLGDKLNAFQKEESERRRDESTRSMWLIGLLVTTITTIMPLLFELFRALRHGP